jgi:hypothetical protein
MVYGAWLPWKQCRILIVDQFRVCSHVGGHGIAPVFVNRFELDMEKGWLNMFTGEYCKCMS